MSAYVLQPDFRIFAHSVSIVMIDLPVGRALHKSFLAQRKNYVIIAIEKMIVFACGWMCYAKRYRKMTHPRNCKNVKMKKYGQFFPLAIAFFPIVVMQNS